MALLTKIKQFYGRPWLEKTQSLGEVYWSLKSRYYYRLFFGKIGSKSKIIKPMRLRNVENIYIEDHVIISQSVFLLTLQTEPLRIPKLVFGSGSTIGHMNHITCVHEVAIGRSVLTADRVYISDHSHDFSDPRVPILEQSVISKSKVSIGEGTWIGENAVVLCCTIGKHCVIGANAVVIHDVPDYCVAAGNPARIIKRFNPKSGSWERVETAR
jgi:acetyltransferase-like isoleucine patch superfamily enzyme